MSFKNFYDFWKGKYEDTPPVSQINIDLDEDTVSLDEIWETVMPKNLQRSKDDQQPIDNELKDSRDNTFVYYKPMPDICKVLIPKNRNKVEEFQCIEINENPHYRVLIESNKAGVVSNIDLYGMKLEVTCNHVLALMTMKEMSLYKQLNPQIVVKTKKQPTQSITWLVKQSDKVDWYTKSISKNKHVYINTSVTQVINLQILCNSRYKLASVMIIINIPYNTDLLYSGTIIGSSFKPYIVTFVNHSKANGVTTILAVAAMIHDIEFQIEDEV
jgi:hypothetical protein